MRVYTLLLLFFERALLLASALLRCALCLPFPKRRIELLRLSILRGGDGDGRASVEMREVLDQEDLRDLEQDEEAKQDEEVPTPEIRDVQPEAKVHVVAPLNNLLAWDSSEKRTHLIRAQSGTTTTLSTKYTVWENNVRIFVDARWVARNNRVTVTYHLNHHVS